MKGHRWGILMASPKIHQADPPSVELRVGASPAAWGGFTPLPRLLEGSKRLFAGLSIVILILVWGTACAPRQLKPVASVDPAPFLEAVNSRRVAFESGLSGSLELAFKNREQHFNSKVYIVAYPDGRFRLEIPGPFGGTHLIMASDNAEILAFYPGEGKAYRSTVDGRSINPHLPFPLPIDPSMLPAMIMGVFPEGGHTTGAQAHLMDSGEKQLQTTVGAYHGELQYTYLFGKGSGNRLRQVAVKGEGMEVSVRTARDNGNLPRDFTITLTEGVLKGEWDSVALFRGDETDLWLHFPDSVPITDLEAPP